MNFFFTWISSGFPRPLPLGAPAPLPRPLVFGLLSETFVSFVVLAS